MLLEGETPRRPLQQHAVHPHGKQTSGVSSLLPYSIRIQFISNEIGDIMQASQLQSLKKFLVELVTERGFEKISEELAMIRT